MVLWSSVVYNDYLSRANTIGPQSINSVIDTKFERPYREMDKYIGYQYCGRFASPLLYLDDKSY